MKKMILTGLLAVLMLSCSTDDEPMFFFEFVPVTNVENVPENFILNKADTLTVSFERPTTCYRFQGFDYERMGTQRDIAVVARVIEDGGPCNTITDNVENVPFIFRPEATGTVTLRFFNGSDSEGAPTYLEFEVPIVEE